MGKYINKLNDKFVGVSFIEKCTSLLDYGAIEVTKDLKFTHNLICVVDNGFFAAAAWAYSESEFNAFNEKDDLRIKKMVYNA